MHLVLQPGTVAREAGMRTDRGKPRADVTACGTDSAKGDHGLAGTRDVPTPRDHGTHRRGAREPGHGHGAQVRDRWIPLLTSLTRVSGLLFSCIR